MGLKSMFMNMHLSRVSWWALTLAASLMAQAQVANSPAGGATLSLTPRNGQSASQQTADRSECAHWARTQTGFDETAPGGGVGPGEYFSKRQQYDRAIGACLDAHGYTVQYAAVPPPPPPAGYAAPRGAPAYGDSGPGYGAPIYAYPESRSPAFGWSPFHVHVDGGLTVTAGDAGNSFNDGANVGAGFSVFPVQSFPLGIRADGSWSYFRAADQLLFATNANDGHEDVYGGDVDLQLNLLQIPREQLYLLGGVGWYREHTVLQQVSFVNGTVCDFFFCGNGFFPVQTAEASFTTSWHDAWNAGIGWEFAVADRGSFFVEVRYLRIRPNSDGQQFVPIRVGYRF
jgi:hypothetical protein